MSELITLDHLVVARSLPNYDPRQPRRPGTAIVRSVSAHLADELLPNVVSGERSFGHDRLQWQPPRSDPPNASAGAHTTLVKFPPESISSLAARSPPSVGPVAHMFEPMSNLVDPAQTICRPPLPLPKIVDSQIWSAAAQSDRPQSGCRRTHATCVRPRPQAWSHTPRMWSNSVVDPAHTRWIPALACFRARLEFGQPPQGSSDLNLVNPPQVVEPAAAPWESPKLGRTQAEFGGTRPRRGGR